MLIVIVLVVSYLLSVFLNKLAENKGWKSKALEYIEKKPAMRNVPIVVGVIGVICLVGLSKIGMNIYLLASLQVIIVTLAVFFFELFRDV